MADNDNSQPKQSDDDQGSTEGRTREIIPLAAAAFLGALTGAIVGSALG